MSVKNTKVNDYEKSTAVYFNMISKLKSLSKQEEKKLWENFHNKKDLSAREKLIQANLKFVPTVAKYFKGCGLPFADIVEEGNIGLIKAIDRFDPKKDNKVISYAIWWIRKTILEAIEKKGLLDVDNIDEINKFYNLEENEDIDLTNIYESDDVEIKINCIEETLPNEKQIIEELFEGIPEREKIILSDYYGLYSDNPKTLDELGEEYNLTKERIRQLNEKSLTKMRANALFKNIHYS